MQLEAGTPHGSTSLYTGTESLTHSFTAVLGIGSRATVKGKYPPLGIIPPPFFFLRQDLSELPRLDLNLPILLPQSLD